MTVKFRPRVGPFMWQPSHGPGMSGSVVLMLIFFVKVMVAVSIVWPLQIIWYFVRLFMAATDRKPYVEVVRQSRR